VPDSIPAARPEGLYTYDEVVRIANHAAVMVADELGLSDSGARDVVNLVVNAVGGLMRNPDTASLDQVIRDSHSEDPEEVRAWATGVYGW
jgi:hypothetical protein